MVITKKYRQIRILNNKDNVVGVSLPKDFNKNWLDIFVTITESGNSIILESGCKPSAMSALELKNSSKKIGKINL